MKKYEFTGEIREETQSNGDVLLLKKIRALIHIEPYGVRAGDEGGWILSEDNLSHRGTCWVDENSMIFGKGCVRDHAFISEGSIVRERAIVGGRSKLKMTSVSGDTRIHDNVTVLFSKIDGESEFFGTALIETSVLSNVQMKTTEFLHVARCTIRARERFLLLKKAEFSGVDMELESGEVGAQLLMEDATGHSIHEFLIKSPATIKRVSFLGEVSLSIEASRTSSEENKQTEIIGESLVVIENGVFVLRGTMITGETRLSGGVSNELLGTITIEDAKIAEYAQVKSSLPGISFRLSDVRFSGISIFQFSNPAHTSYEGLRLSQDVIYK